MLARKVTATQIEDAARSLGFETMELRRSGTGFRFRIVPPSKSDKYRKLSSNAFSRGRRVHAICWHGHREFFRKLFTLAPDAIVITALARYTASNFEETYPNTDKNIGPPIAPIYYSEACDCASRGLA